MKGSKKGIVFNAGVTIIMAFVIIGITNHIANASFGDNKVNDDPHLHCNRIYDVNRDGTINFQDAGLCWVYIQNDLGDSYGDLLYDVNMDGQVNFQDCGIIWVHRD